MKHIIFKCLSVAVLFFTVVSCKNDMDVDPYQSGDKVNVSFAVGVDGPTKKPQRIADNTYDKGDESHTNNPNYGDGESHQIGDGTLAHNLAYALYTPNGDLVERHDTIVETFPCQVNLELVRGLKYQLVMWAQSDNAGNYYDTQDLCNIFVKYDASVNNDDARDAFCVSQEVLVKGESSSSISVVLHRPFAQVNVGIAKEVWETLQYGGVNILSSSLSIYNAGCRFDLAGDEVILPTAEDATENRTTADFSKTALPQETLKITENGQEKEYVWISMSYILANTPKKTDPALVDIVDMAFYYGDESATAETANEILKPSSLPMYDVPVRRNYRTNILFDGDLTGTARVVLELNKNFDDADYWAQYDESKELDWHGEIADGVTFRSYRNDDTKKSYYGLFWIDFYVSNENGLRWIADRSNGMPFKESDIPTWENSQGKTTTYKIFQNQAGNPDLNVYIAFIKSMVMGHGLIPNGVTEGRFNSPDSYNKQYRYYANKNDKLPEATTTIVQPWTFDDCSIILTNDIDFGGRLWRPISSVQFFGLSKDNGRAIKNFPDPANAFKGEFDGNGHTISNMHIDNRRASDNWWDSYQAGIVGIAAENTVIKNLTLYNALIEGDWNLGGMVGYFNTTKSNLIIENCRIENSILIAYGDSVNSDDDANVGGFAGSVNGSKAILTNCHISNTILRSDMNVGGFIGILSAKYDEIRNCSMSNVSMILNEFNTSGASESKDYAKRDTREPHKYLFGSRGVSIVENTSVTDVTINMFLSDTKESTAGNGDGSNYISNIPLNMFPVLDGRYSTSLKIGSHITGTPSYKHNNKSYGLYIDISQNPNWTPKRPTDGFTLEGVVREGKPLYSLNVIPDGTTYGVGIYGKGSSEDKCEAVIKNLVINGIPSLNAAIYVNAVKEVELENVALYDAEYTIQTTHVPDDAKLVVTNSDLRGKTDIGNYQAIFDNTIFDFGSGNINNRKGQLKTTADAEFKSCVFRQGFSVEIPEGVTLTFTNCHCQISVGKVLLTADNVDQYLQGDNLAERIIFQ